MKTIMILAEALSKAAGKNISRLDILYNSNSETYSARLWIEDAGDSIKFVYDISENGTVTVVTE